MSPAIQSWTVTRRLIEEQAIDGMRLGRHVHHDSRSRAYPWRRSGGPLASELWPRHIPILDQGSYGSCTGEAEDGCCGCDPLFTALPPGTALGQAEALALYSAAEIIDGGSGLPSEDSGSSGLSACQAAKNAGLISGYTHCFSLMDVLDALQSTPLIIGVNWYGSMDSPDSSGLVTISPGGSVRGGHEILVRGIDVTAQQIFLDNSWGTGWGQNGSFIMSWATLDRLLAEQGDGTVSIPLSAPAPVPVPVPPVPPPPGPGPVADAADQALWNGISAWARHHHYGSDRHAAEDAIAWARAKGLSA